MKDNTVNADGVEVYLHDIYYYADEYIKNILEIDKVTKENIKEVTDSFLDMIYYISDRIQKPSNDDIELLDDIFNIFKRLCARYKVTPSLECFSFLVKINNSTFSDWANGEYRTTTAHGKTVKKWFEDCKNIFLFSLQNSKGTDANKIFIAKAAYGMAEAIPNQPAEPQGIPQQTPAQIAERYAHIALEEPKMPEL